MSANRSPHTPRSSPAQLLRTNSSRRLSSNPRSSLELFHHTSTRTHSMTSQPRSQQSHKAQQIISAAKLTPSVSSKQMTFTSQASSDTFKRALQTGHGLGKQAPAQPGIATSVSPTDRRVTNSGYTRAPVSEPGRRANKTSVSSGKSAPPKLQTPRPKSTVSSSMDSTSISSARPPTSIWTSTGSAPSIHTYDLNYQGFSQASKRAERLAALTRLSMKPLPKVISALANNKVPSGAGSSSIGQHVLSSCAKRVSKARK